MKKIIYTLMFLVFASMANGQWVQTSNGIGTDSMVYSLTSIGNNIFAGANVNQSGPGRVYISTNNGINWILTSSLSFDCVQCVGSQGTTLFAGTDDGIWRSTNNGSNWTNPLPGGLTVFVFTVFGNEIYAGTWSPSSIYGAFRSTDNGLNWTYCGLDGKSVYSFAKLNNNVFAGTTDSGLYISTNNGTSWTQTLLKNRTVHSLATLGNNIFAGSDTGLNVSSNNGTSWIQTSLFNKYVLDLAISGNNIFAVADGSFYLSTDNGTTWVQKSEGLNNNIFIRLLIANSYVFAGTFGQSVWRRPLSEVIGIKNISTEIPSTYSLEQNYPNPFNPSTNIKFELPKSNYVTLKIYDALGREIATLVNEQLKAGKYEVDFDGSNYASGVYYYKLMAVDFVEMRKMILVK